MPKTGEQPGVGAYTCLSCGQEIHLDQDSDQLPPCPSNKCAGVYFSQNYSNYREGRFGPKYDGESKKWQTLATTFAGKGTEESSAYEKDYKKEFGTSIIDGETVAGVALPSGLEGSTIPNRLPWGTQVAVEEVTFIPSPGDGDVETRKLEKPVKLRVIDRGPGPTGEGGIDLTPAALNELGFDQSMEARGRFEVKFKILLP